MRAFVENTSFYRQSPPAVRAELMRTMRGATLDAGQFFYRQGDACAHFALVCAGDVRVYKSCGEGREVTVYHSVGGEPCAVNLLSVLLGQPATANARAEAQTSVVLFPGDRLDGWMSESEPLRRFVIESIGARLSGVMSLVEDIAFRGVDIRLAGWLLERFASDRVVEVTHDAIAAELGTAREVVSRVMRELARRGAIQSTRGRIVLRDAEVLRQII